MRTLLIILLVCSAAEQFKLRCEVVCEQDGNELGIVLNNRCYCADSRDIKRVPTRINRNMTTNSQPEKGIYEY